MNVPDLSLTEILVLIGVGLLLAGVAVRGGKRR